MIFAVVELCVISPVIMICLKFYFCFISVPPLLSEVDIVYVPVTWRLLVLW